MRHRNMIASALFGLLLTACSGGQGQAPPPASPTVDAAAWLQGTPVNWVDRQEGQPPVVPHHEQACMPDPGAQAPVLQVTLLDAAWTLHPLVEQERFWAPVATLAVCNIGTPMTEGIPLHPTYSGHPGLDRPGRFMVPALKSGEGLGPFRLFANEGVPEPTGLLWSQEGERWPELTLTMASPALSQPTSIAVKRELVAGPTQAVPGQAAKSEDLTAPTLPFVAWDQITFGDPQVMLFLYAPDARYSVQDSPYCGAPVGAVNAEGIAWAFYRSSGTGAPELALKLGARGFDARRAVAAAESRPELGITFLPLAQYGSCATLTYYELYAYDHKSGELYRPLMETDSGELRPATASQYTLAPDGTLTSSYYLNAGAGAGHNTLTYRWDGPARTWRLVSHTRN